MEAVDMTLKLFRAMDDEEKRATILALGEEIEDTRLVEKLTGGTKPKPKKKGAPRATGGRPYWLRHVSSVDDAADGVMALEGTWLSLDAVSALNEGELIVLGIKWPKKKYALLRKKKSAVERIEGGPDGSVEVKDALLIKVEDTFGAIKEHVEVALKF